MTDLETFLPEGWETDGYGLSSNLICPHGRQLEQDGWHTVAEYEARRDEEAGQRCESPLLTQGLI